VAAETFLAAFTARSAALFQIRAAGQHTLAACRSAEAFPISS
jgi:hypothetical protein